MAKIDGVIASYIGNFKGYQGNPPTTEEEFNNLTPLNGEDTVWENTPPTWSAVQAKVTELDDADAQKVTDKASAVSKLEALGLTSSEIDAFTK